MIQIFHVHKRYDKDIEALRDINLKFDKGEFAFLTGPSGAGKTTLMRLILCQEQVSSGQILVDGRNIARLKASQIPPLRRQIGVVFQDFKLMKRLSTADNVALALDVIGMKRSLKQKRVNAVLQAVGLAHKANSLPLRMSAGEQQRVAIARALVNAPKILLADEPTGNLDSELTQEIMDLLETINARGTTVVVATHDQALLDGRQKRVIRLKDGNVVES